ncbi:LOW QUALITY PROTEIN: auxin-responsive protein SAUR76-like [Lycium ferocissimum]|uniref:LOW QUALITY PROTEIN: auxin-responsive protein SAUR76-like n=1 Tax=Lycium ferocissimum TaxID=112874 RepID=UPI002815C773|nr:LOW QUALITY PROTEIN: auxin-responsive protein SAUR76-like [Lycium ferocissimum]
MAKGGNKLTKLKSVLKKMQSFKIGRSSTILALDDSHSYEDQHTVHVGKSRRHYLVSSDVVCHPLFFELAERSGDSIAVGCEVVLFEYLLWMFDNADPQPESLDELVEFYSC